jgi:hypothetical protein
MYFGFRLHCFTSGVKNTVEIVILFDVICNRIFTGRIGEDEDAEISFSGLFRKLRIFTNARSRATVIVRSAGSVFRLINMPFH